MAYAVILSWFVALALGVFFTWSLRGHKAISFTLGFAVVGIIWLCFFIVPLRLITG